MRTGTKVMIGVGAGLGLLLLSVVAYEAHAKAASGAALPAPGGMVTLQTGRRYKLVATCPAQPAPPQGESGITIVSGPSPTGQPNQFGIVFDYTAQTAAIQLSGITLDVGCANAAVYDMGATPGGSTVPTEAWVQAAPGVNSSVAVRSGGTVDIQATPVVPGQGPQGNWDFPQLSGTPTTDGSLNIGSANWAGGILSDVTGSGSVQFNWADGSSSSLRIQTFA